MKTFCMFVLLGCVGAASGLAALKAGFSPIAPFNNPKDRATVRQIEERGLGDAILAVDMQKLDQIYADDFAMLSPSGKIMTKQDILQQIQSGKYKLLSYAQGPVDVQVLGNHAIGVAVVTESRLVDGRTIHAELIYEDHFVKRNGEWKLFRSDSGFPK
jgi:ketosteroid isomerase-like protein